MYGQYTEHYKCFPCIAACTTPVQFWFPRRCKEFGEKPLNILAWLEYQNGCNPSAPESYTDGITVI